MRALTASGPAYKLLLEKAVGEQIEQEAARLEQLSTLKSKDRNPEISGGDIGEQKFGSGNDDAPKPRKSVRSKSRPQREGKFGWNRGTIELKPPLKDPKIHRQ